MVTVKMGDESFLCFEGEAGMINTLPDSPMDEAFVF
jgi:hypothetical protein